MVLLFGRLPLWKIVVAKINTSGGGGAKRKERVWYQLLVVVGDGCWRQKTGSYPILIED
jgi:hypothetical protein